MWGCLGKFMVLMTVLMLLGTLSITALGIVAVTALPHAIPERVTANFGGLDATAEMRVSTLGQQAGRAGHDPFMAFGMAPGEWLLLLLLGLCGLLTVVMAGGMLGMYRHNRKREPDAARDSETMQELHHLALRMDARIESLETILLGHGRGNG